MNLFRWLRCSVRSLSARLATVAIHAKTRSAAPLTSRSLNVPLLAAGKERDGARGRTKIFELNHGDFFSAAVCGSSCLFVFCHATGSLFCYFCASEFVLNRKSCVSSSPSVASAASSRLCCSASLFIVMCHVHFSRKLFQNRYKLPKSDGFHSISIEAECGTDVLGPAIALFNIRRTA